jgi:hypothetical protein
VSLIEEAANQLRKAIAAYEGIAQRTSSYGPASRDEAGRTLACHRERIAHGFGELAAVEKGLLTPEMVGEIVARATAGN